MEITKYFIGTVTYFFLILLLLLAVWETRCIGLKVTMWLLSWDIKPNCGFGIQIFKIMNKMYFSAIIACLVMILCHHRQIMSSLYPMSLYESTMTIIINLNIFCIHIPRVDYLSHSQITNNIYFPSLKPIGAES